MTQGLFMAKTQAHPLFNRSMWKPCMLATCHNSIAVIFLYPQGLIHRLTTISRPIFSLLSSAIKKQADNKHHRVTRKVRNNNNKMSLVTEEIKASASEVYHGDEMCQEKSKLLLEEMGMPRGLLPLRDIEEVGYVKDTGFVWLKQKKSITHKFEKIGKLVSYATEVTAVVEKKKIKKLSGVKSKELLIWITLNEICVDDPPTGKITFKTPAGLSRSYPVSAFEIECDSKEKK